jgi:ribosome-binding factor A
MKQSKANRKVNEQAKEVIANILLFEISDTRLAHVVIVACEVSFDRSVCNVFYSTETNRYDEVSEAFEAAKGHIRTLMAKKLPWRIVPSLRFILDESVDVAERIDEALRKDRKRNPL